MRSTDRRDTSHPRMHAPAWPARPPLHSGQLFIWLSLTVAVALFGWLPLPMVSAAPLRQAGETAVPVSLVEFEIQMPTELPAGSLTFVVTNDGARQHNFEIEGQGIEVVFAQNLQPGESNILTVDLPPGEYRVYCPVGQHAGQGMELTLTVTPAETAQGSTATAALTETTGVTATQAVTSAAAMTASAQWADQSQTAGQGGDQGQTSEQGAGAAPELMPQTGRDRNAVATQTVPVVALVLLVLAVSAWAVQRRQA